MYWDTLKNGSCLECNVPYSQKRHDRATRKYHGRHGEDALVEEDDRELDNRKAGIPEELHHIQVLFVPVLVSASLTCLFFREIREIPRNTPEQ